jgi:hypothetical protein
VIIARGETFAASFGFGALMQIMSFGGGLLCAAVVDRLTSSRGMLVAWRTIGALGVDRIGGILGPFIVGGLQQLHPGATASFLAIGAAVLAAAISLGLGVEVRRERRDLNTCYPAAIRRVRTPSKQRSDGSWPATSTSM